MLRVGKRVVSRKVRKRLDLVRCYGHRQIPGNPCANGKRLAAKLDPYFVYGESRSADRGSRAQQVAADGQDVVPGHRLGEIGVAGLDGTDQPMVL